MDPSNNLLSDLIVNNLIDTLSNIEEYRNLCLEHKEDILFNARCANLIKEKITFERRVLIQTSTKSMISESLKLLSQRYINNQKLEFEFQKKLIDKYVVPVSSQSQVSYYNERVNEFDHLINDYFFSFTNRKNNPHENNIIHINYKHFIRFILNCDRNRFQKLLRDSEEKNINLLAKAINYIISQKLRGFYYPSHIGDNSDVIQKLTSNCTSSFAFVQLIQDVIFEYCPDETNYCHLEYNTIKRCIPENRRFFILAERRREDIRDNTSLHQSFEDWHSNFTRYDPLHLPFSMEYNQREIIETKELIEDKIANKIKELKNKLIENVPG